MTFPSYQSMQQTAKDQHLMRLGEAQERFASSWKPRDKRDEDRFRMELNYLVHNIYREAQEPLIRQLTDISMRMPLPHFVGDKL